MQPLNQKFTTVNALSANKLLSTALPSRSLPSKAGNAPLADVVVLCLPGTRETAALFSARRLALMKRDAVVVNTARGAVVDTAALARALEAGKLWGAGLDVYEEEPIGPDHPLMRAPHTVLTSHAAYWSEESGIELRTRTMRNAVDVVQGRRPADCLSPQVLG